MADTPSTMKLLEKLRWLPTEMPLPGTAEVSAKSCVLATLVGETPGTSRREVEEVAAVHGQRIRLRGRHRARDLAAGGLEDGRLPGDGDVLLEAADLEGDRQLEGRAGVQGERAADRLEPLLADDQLVRSDLQEREAEAAVLIRHRRRLDVRLV